MTKNQTLPLATEVVRIEQALSASLRGLRALAETLCQKTDEAATREALEKYLARAVGRHAKAPPKRMREKTLEPDRRLRRVQRMLSDLSDGQLRMVTDLARAMTREAPRKERPSGAAPKQVPEGSGEKPSTHLSPENRKDVP